MPFGGLGWGILIGTVVGGGTMFWAADGLDATSRAIKWGVIGAGVYLAGRHMKAW